MFAPSFVQTLRSLPLALALLAAAGPAFAADAPRLYGRIAAGGALASDLVSGGAAATARFSPKAGWLAGAALGYRLDDPLRLEVELAYRRHGLGGAFVRNARIACGAPQIPCLAGGIAGGRLTSSSALVLAAWDLSPLAGVTPYIGGGAGLMRLGLRAAAPSVVIDDADTLPAYRVGAGLRTTIDAVTLSLDYSATITGGLGLASSRVPAAAFTVGGHARTHALTLGAAFSF